MSQFPGASKTRAPTFNLDAVFDKYFEIVSVSQAFDPEHPLLTDRERLDHIADIMYARIQKTLFPGESWDDADGLRRVNPPMHATWNESWGGLESVRTTSSPKRC